MIEQFTTSFGWIELVFFYGIAIGFGTWQALKMRREVREMRAEREAREAREALEVEEAGDNQDAPRPKSPAPNPPE